MNAQLSRSALYLAIAAMAVLPRPVLAQGDSEQSRATLAGIESAYIEVWISEDLPLSDYQEELHDILSRELARLDIEQAESISLQMDAMVKLDFLGMPLTVEGRSSPSGYGVAYRLEVQQPAQLMRDVGSVAIVTTWNVAGIEVWDPSRLRQDAERLTRRLADRLGNAIVDL